MKRTILKIVVIPHCCSQLWAHLPQWLIPYRPPLATPDLAQSGRSCSLGVAGLLWPLTPVSVFLELFIRSLSSTCHPEVERRFAAVALPHAFARGRRICSAALQGKMNFMCRCPAKWGPPV